MNTKKFIKELAKTGIIGYACKNTGVSRKEYRLKIKEDKIFKRNCDDAIEDSIDLVEFTLRDRALNGTKIPITHMGQQIWMRDPETGEILLDDNSEPIALTQKKQSDPLLMFYIKSNRDKYKNLIIEDDVDDIPKKITIAFKK